MALAAALWLAAGCSAEAPAGDGGAPDAFEPVRDAPDAEGPRDADLADAPAFDAEPARDAPAIDAPAIDAPARDAGPPCPERPPLGLWVWNDDLVATRDAILDLAAGAGVTEIYLHANLFYAGDVPEDVLAAWIDAASARCIGVELLFGNARWLRPAERAEATARAAWTVAFAAAHPSARPTGVHFDLEPQQLAAWDDPAMRPALLSELVDTLAAMRPVAEAAGLRLSADVGFFLDGYPVDRGGTTRPASEWVTDAVSRLVIMDYRDSAESMGYGGMISLARTEIDYATRVGVPVVLGAETDPVSPEYVTFAEEGRAAMFAELARVRAAFAGTALEGLALHDRDGLAALPP